MKNLKITKAIFFAEQDESINCGEFVYLKNHITIDILMKLDDNVQDYFIEGFSDSEKQIGLFWMPMKTNLGYEHIASRILDVPYFTKDDRDRIDNEMVESKRLDCRHATNIEKNLVKSYLSNEFKRLGLNITEEQIISDFEKSIHIVFYITDDYKILISSVCDLHSCADGKKKINSYDYKYAIKHGFVYPYDNSGEFGEIFDDIEEDISVIKSILEK